MGLKPTMPLTLAGQVIEPSVSVPSAAQARPAAIAGYPHLSVPMGAVHSLPVGLSIIGAKWDDAAVLKAGAAYEKARTATLAEPGFAVWTAAGE